MDQHRVCATQIATELAGIGWPKQGRLGMERQKPKQISLYRFDSRRRKPVSVVSWPSLVPMPYLGLAARKVNTCVHMDFCASTY
jgi:hypothetical protein